MLTAVFACQPLGQLTATLVALIATARQRGGIPADATVQNCDAQCLRTMDSVWRWIIGVGVIPAVIALWFRLTIIESPRYTADVGRDSRKAASELKRYLLFQAESGIVSNSIFPIPNEHSEAYQLRRASAASSGAISNAGSGAVSEVEMRVSRELSPHDVSGFSAPRETLDANGVPKQVNVATSHATITSVEIPSPRSISPVQYSETYNRELARERGSEGSQLEALPEVETPPPPSWKDFKKYFWHDGNFRTLIATSFCWFCKHYFPSLVILQYPI